MIICMKAKRKDDGAIDTGRSPDFRAVREADVSEATREDGGKVLVRVDGEPAEYWDAVFIGDRAFTSDEFRDAAARCPNPLNVNGEAPKRGRGRPRKNA